MAVAVPCASAVAAPTAVQRRRPISGTAARRGAAPLAIRPMCTRVASASTCGRVLHGIGRRGAHVAAGSAAAGAAEWPATPSEEDLPPADNPHSKLHDFIHDGMGSVVLLAATALSIFLANSSLAPSWCGLWNTHVGPALGGHQLTVNGWINEGLMAIFFFVVGLEIKREIKFGALANIKAALLPCLAALGGMVVPMACYALLNMGTGGLMSGWAIPMATDIAFAMGVFGFFSKKMPKAASAFLLTLATVDDLGAIAVIAVFFATHISVPYLSAAAVITATLFALPKMFKRVNAWMYAVGGAALWYCLLVGGVNADVAGVAAAFAVPSSQLAPANTKAQGMEAGLRPTLIDHFVHNLLPFTALLIMPLFALANTAVPIDLSMLGMLFTQPVAAGIMAGLLLGKPIGITAFSLLGIKLGMVQMPEGMTTAHLVVLGLLGGIGFTMCLFLIALSLSGFPDASRLAKLAVIAASGVAAVGGAAIMNAFPTNEETEPASAPAPST
mmetsp:Transcript_10598/g.26936  ORF Transcript_10598/g.26936 Transcript_10598/m.26936 type:complete len:501 (-) Transcript_10598:336-1838(-)